MGWFRDDFYSTRPAGSGRKRGRGGFPRLGGWERTRREGLLGGRGWRRTRTVASSVFGKERLAGTPGLVPWLAVSGMMAIVSFIVGGLLVWGLLTVGGGNGGEAVTALAPVPSVPPVQDTYNEKIVAAVDRVHPAIVSVVSKVKDEESGEAIQAGLGSGIIFAIVEGKARIVTNYHVIEQGETFEIVTVDGRHREAKVIGRDMLSDLAVLEAKASGLTVVAEFGDSSALKAGQTAIAIGNPLGLGYSHTTTVGVISSTHRTIPVSLGGNGFYDWEMQVIQTDAPINQGNSGGALVNLDGQVIGINSLKISSFGVEGLGFAIPSNEALPVIDSLVLNGKVMRPYIGVYTHDLEVIPEDEADELALPDRVETGVVVLDAVGPAEDAGLQAKDVIVALDDEPIGTTLALRKHLYERKRIGDELLVTFYRDGEKRETVLVLGELERNEG